MSAPKSQFGHLVAAMEDLINHPQHITRLGADRQTRLEIDQYLSVVR